MIKEFEGRTEKEAIDNAVKALNINAEDFDVEIVGTAKKSLFRKGTVKIKVHIEEDFEEEGEPRTDFEEKAVAFFGKTY